ncbi:MAG TPA: NADH-quinone oxidoreductase subunit H [Planctomycetaceae bacterium]|nr:NADH-quinone oxidoreductase subunit H [Planctomycetaceae bacterium]HQZ63854.1 NADH-quinone oxidoreductase subunit H [Planctomycetaceae bacterium]
MILAAQSIAEFFSDFGACQYVIAAVIHAVLLIHVFAVSPFAFIWLERKVSGRIQDRLGPTRVGGLFGWLQSLADGIKLIQKEDLCPSAADSMLFRSAPYIVCVSSFAAFMVLPFSDGWVAVAADCGLFIILAILSLEVFGIIMAGYSSGSKWSLFGGMREAAQMVSYEIPLAICALVPVIAAGSLNLGEIGGMQRGWMTNWFLFHDPFTFITFFVYFVVATASCKRAPFDLAEAESELVGGFHTEYSGMRWSFFFMGEYASMFAVCGIAAILFLGGWNTGIGPIDDALYAARAAAADGTGSAGVGYLANVIGAGVFAAKASFGVFVQVWLRWTLPRLRIDQVMTTCLKYLVPISCFLFLGATLWPLVLLMIMGRATWNSPIGDRAAQGLQEARQGNVEVSQAIEPRVDVSLVAPALPKIELEGVVQ